MAKHKEGRRRKTWFDKGQWIILAGVVVFAVLIRVIPQMGYVFTDGMVLYRGVDAWYHMRLADVMAHNFPNPLLWDYYTIYPMGMDTGYRPFVTWIVTLPSVVGLDYHTWGAFVPPIAGGLCIVAVFFLVRELLPKSRFMPILASFLMAMLPSEFFHRSMLGFTDHHVFEVLFTIMGLLFMTMAIKRNKLFAFGTGVSLGMLSLSWYGMPLLVLPIFIWYLIMFLHKTREGEPTNDLHFITFVTGIIALVVSAPIFYYHINGWKLTLLSLALLVVLPWVFEGIKRALHSFKRVLPAVLLILAGGVAIAPLFGYLPQQLFKSVFWGFEMTVWEGMPATPDILLGAYGMAFVLSMIGLVFYLYRKQGLLFSIWALILLFATIGERRWGYYLSIFVAVLAPYAIYQIARWVSPHIRSFAIGMMCCFAIFPSLSGTVALSNQPLNITQDWISTCNWLREHTPKSTTDAEGYYSLDPKPRPNYTIMAWWDYGNWITVIGHRVTSANPILHSTWVEPERAWKYDLTSFYYSCGNNFDFFAATSKEEATQTMRNLDARYVVLDSEILTGKFYAIGAEKGVELKEEDAFIWRIANGLEPDYQLVFNTPTVKVYEWQGYEP